MLLEIDTNDSRLAFDIMDNNNLSSGEKKELFDDISIEYKDTFIRKAFGIPETITFILSFGSGVGAGLIANWIYDKIKNRATSIRINRKVTIIDKDHIFIMIQEEMKAIRK